MEASDAPLPDQVRKTHRTEASSSSAVTGLSLPLPVSEGMSAQVSIIASAVFDRFKQHLGVDAEVEARLCEIRGVPKAASSRIVSEKHSIEVGVDRKTFTTVSERLGNSAGVTVSSTDSVDVRTGDLRTTKQNGTVTTIKKVRKAVVDVQLAGTKYDLRFAVSAEVPVEPRAFPDALPQDARKKQRKSFRLEANVYDLTVVESRGRVTREIEVERVCTSEADVTELVQHALGLANST